MTGESTGICSSHSSTRGIPEGHAGSDKGHGCVLSGVLLRVRRSAGPSVSPSQASVVLID
jgi:hypothetical protein